MDNYAKLTDTELVARCLDADNEAWAALVLRYQRLIASITRKFRLGDDDAQDVYQSVNLALFQQLNNLRDNQKLSAWIIKVSVRECWKLRERGRYLDSLDEPDAPQPSTDDHLAMEANIQLLEQQHLLRRAVAALPDKCRELIEILFFRESSDSYENISRRLGIPIPGIGPTRGRCLEKLKKNLQKNSFF